MTPRMQHTIQHLFRVNSLEEVSRERLEELVTNYPSFSVGRYLLSRKLHAEQDGHFPEETQRTNLYFTNPFWLQWLLQNEEPVATRSSIVEVRPALPEEKPATAVEAPLNDGEEGNGVEPPSGEIFFQEKLTVSEEATPREPSPVPEDVQAGVLEGPEDVQGGVKESQENVPAGVKEQPEVGQTEAKEAAESIDPRVKELLEAVRGGVKETPEAVQGGVEGTLEAVQGGVEENAEAAQAGAKENPEAPLSGSAPEEEPGAISQSNREERPRAILRSIQVEEPGVNAELSAANTSSLPPTAAEALLQYLAEARGLRQTLVQMNEGKEEGTSEEQAPAEGIARVKSVEEVPGPSQTADAGPAGQAAGTEGITREDQPQAGGAPGQEPSTAIVGHAMALAEPVAEFEPYHTIDYFASVGIKFVQEENPSDKLGRQLKSFTDWLKVMRKLPQKNQEIVPDMAAEHQIQAIAAHSIKGKEVLTETMAEVLVKQGMREKAVEVYHKLSLLNPDKSAYFAAKIEQLKID